MKDVKLEVSVVGKGKFDGAVSGSSRALKSAIPQVEHHPPAKNDSHREGLK